MSEQGSTEPKPSEGTEPAATTAPKVQKQDLIDWLYERRPDGQLVNRWSSPHEPPRAVVEQSKAAARALAQGKRPGGDAVGR